MKGKDGWRLETCAKSALEFNHQEVNHVSGSVVQYGVRMWEIQIVGEGRHCVKDQVQRRQV